MRRYAAALLVVALSAPWLAGCGPSGGARADRSYRPVVARPALATAAPLMLFDEGHRNSHRVGSTYRPFARLVEADGVRVQVHREPFTAGSLAGADLLVIVNARGPEPEDHVSPFTRAEIEAVESWVRAGGGLLLVADHTPFGTAAAPLAERFGVKMLDGEVWDESRRDPDGSDPAQIAFAAADGALGDHPIITGRGADERVGRVVTFTGQALGAPPGAARLLVLSASAMDRPVESVEIRQDGSDRKRITTFGDPVPTRGDCQALALSWGAGRVVVAGEAAFLTAQVVGDERFGLASPGTDNERFALNAVRWLAGALGG